MNQKISVALIGAGSMGGALLRGWLSTGVIDAARSAAFDPAPADWLKEAGGVSGVAINPSIGSARFEALVIAVKPQTASDVLPPFAPIAEKSVVISVMAGKTIAAIRKAMPRAREIVRTMPNLPAAIGSGVTALYAPPGVTAEHRAIADRLMRAVGETIWVDSEKAIDTVTAVSGSGPAYFFLLGEALAEAGKAAGLSDEAAMTLARATLSGSGAYVAQDPRSLADLRRAVTSPGGTTEAALKVLDGDDVALRKLVKAAVEAAARRAAALTE